MKNICGGEYKGERALFSSSDLKIDGAVFCDGESPLKESKNIMISNCSFKWKYPLWYCKNIDVTATALDVTARSGIWYTNGIRMTDCLIEAPKTFRRSSGIVLRNVNMPNADETMWNCSDITLNDVAVCGDYFCLGARNVRADRLRIDGNYAFDGGENIEVSNSVLNSKDAFWNCRNVVVRDSVIIGEYLGWNSENVTLINCTIESNQGMCYMKNLTLRGCKLNNTDLCFEYCTVDAEVNSHIDSVKNPISGRIKAYSIGEIILDPDMVDATKTEITESANV